MSDDATQDVYRALIKIGDFLRKAKPEHVKSLLNDEARLEIVPSGWKVSAPPAPRPPASVKARPAQPSAAAVEQGLRAMSKTEEATAFLVEMHLNLSQTRKLAADLGLRGASKMGAEELVELMVRTFVGARLDSDALQRL